jgi:hypothetical protein
MQSRLLARRRLIYAACLAVLAAVGLAGYFRYHLAWKYMEIWHGHAVKEVTNKPMPYVPVPDSWVATQVGEVKLMMPPHDGPYYSSGSVVAYAVEDGEVVVMASLDAREYVPHISARHAADASPLTAPEFRLRMLQADSRDFRWTMTPHEARWHRYYMTEAPGWGHWLADSCEYWFDEVSHGVLLISGNNAFLEWQEADGNMAVQIHFANSTSAMDWIRAVCRSIEVSRELPPPEDAARFFDQQEDVPDLLSEARIFEAHE